MRIETVTIHHPELLREEQVPEETAASWVAQGWLEGPFPSDDGRPPRAGKGSSVTEWLAYASRRDIPVPLEAPTRDDVIAVVEAFDAELASRASGDEPAPQGPTDTTPEEG